MSTPEQPTTTTGGTTQPSYGVGTAMGGARLPIPGNAEFAVYFLAVVLVTIIWAASDRLDAGGFVTAFTALTFGYLLSRGIAKASRVLEQ